MAIVTNRPPGSAGGIQQFVRQLACGAREAGFSVDIVELGAVLPDRTVIGAQHYFEATLHRDPRRMSETDGTAEASSLIVRLRRCEFVVLAGSAPMYARWYDPIRRVLEAGIPPTVLAILFPMQEIEYYLGASEAQRLAHLIHEIAAPCEAVAVPSEFGRRGLVDYFGTSPPVVKIAHGVDACPPKHVPAYSGAGGHVVFVGRMEDLAAHKNVEAAIRVWPAVRQVVAGAELVLVGGGDLVLQCGPGVIRAGHLGDASRDRIVATAAASLLISPLEAYGLVAMESFAVGTPVIGLAAGAVPELITHRVNGLLLDAYPKAVRVGGHVATHYLPRPADLGDAIIELLNNHEVRESLSRGASASARTRTWRTVFDEYRAAALST